MVCNDDGLPKLNELTFSGEGDANMSDDKSESTSVCIEGGVPVKVEEYAHNIGVDKLWVLQEKQPEHGKTTAAPHGVIGFIDNIHQSNEAIYAQGAGHGHVDAQSGSNEAIYAQ